MKSEMMIPIKLKINKKLIAITNLGSAIQFKPAKVLFKQQSLTISKNRPITFIVPFDLNEFSDPELHFYPKFNFDIINKQTIKKSHVKKKYSLRMNSIRLECVKVMCNACTLNSNLQCPNYHFFCCNYDEIIIEKNVHIE